AAQHGASSRTLTAFRDSANIPEELARKAAVAQKTGDAVLVLPYSESGFRALETFIAANEIRFNEIGLEFVTFSSLARAYDDATASLGSATNPPSAKPPPAKPKPAGPKPTGAKAAGSKAKTGAGSREKAGASPKATGAKTKAKTSPTPAAKPAVKRDAKTKDASGKKVPGKTSGAP